MNIISRNELITLYHGSKSGIHGAIAPISVFKDCSASFI